jgi:hypothetical protein
MGLSKDWREFLELLNSRGVDYVIVGAHSLALHGLGRAPTRIDLLISISGVSRDEACASKASAELDGIPVFVLAKDALIRNKRAVGRPQDLADFDTLEN